MTEIEKMIAALKILSQYSDKPFFWAEHDEFGVYNLLKKPSKEDCEILNKLRWFKYGDECPENGGAVWFTFV